MSWISVQSRIRCWILLTMLAVCHANTDYNVTFEYLHKCKQYNAVSGYNYRAFFKLHELEHHGTLDANLTVDLLLFVMGPRDGHILLSQEEKASNDSLEIVLGGGGNSFSTIRQGAKGGGIKAKQYPGLLSPIFPLPVRIRIDNMGLVKVYCGNLTADVPFMETTSDKLRENPARYVSFSSWSTALSKWFYDCPPEDAVVGSNGTIVGSELEIVRTNQELLHQMLHETPRWTEPPERFTGINITTLYVQEFTYDQMTDIVGLSGMLRLRWYDPRYGWNASEYGEIPFVVEACDVLWMPYFEASLFSGSFSTCYVHSDGLLVVDIDEFTWYNYCSQADNYHWPYDSNVCSVMLYAVAYNRTVPLRMNSTALMYEIAFEQSEWSLTGVAVHGSAQSNTPYGLLPALELHMQMSRKSDIHLAAIYPSYFVANLLISLSFLISGGRTRLLLNTLGLIILLKSFLSLSIIVPRSGVPKIYIFFQLTLLFYALSLILHVVDLWLKRTRATIAPTSWLNRAINFPALRYILAMDQRSNYNTLDHKNVLWDEVTQVLGRIMMVAELIVLCIGFSSP
ncbi:neuronal acetylcholine receptor subunit non-alpha-2-like isoform X2 [Anopheles albimanus]|uniref:Neurotransmitter-gated ion-channel ligand-binding domain-containing protein n=1 Tax=Anopheles albimanus TaxID=7167 RepID=A0A182FV05_ANOAL|nr:neuronal acetylcholine receptor subunit non-alpha-2-like isoform X2 [Anopheles albimanus]